MRLKVAEARVSNNLKKPRLRIFASKGRKCPESLYERILYSIFGVVGVAQIPMRQVISRIQMPNDLPLKDLVAATHGDLRNVPQPTDQTTTTLPVILGWSEQK